jgi:hypothetical protein
VFVPRIYPIAVQMVWLLPGGVDDIVATWIRSETHWERTARSLQVSGGTAAQRSAIMRNP